MTDWSRVQMFDSPQIQNWPEEVHISALHLATDGVSIEVSDPSALAAWPDVRFGAAPDTLQYTLGIARMVPGNIFASAVIQFWRGLPKNGGDVLAPGQLATNWFYDSRWGPLQGWQPAAGELVGFFIMAGNGRNVLDGSQSPRQARSDMAVITWDGKTRDYTFAPPAPPVPVPTPAPPAPLPAVDRELLLKVADAFQELADLFTEIAGPIA